MVWDITIPAGTEAANNGDNRIRELKSDIQTALRAGGADGDEAKFPGTDPSNPIYRYRGAEGSTAGRPVAGQGGLFANSTTKTLQRDNGTSWEDIATLIDSGTVMVFFQSAAPTGWTQLVAQNDKALRVTNSNGGGGGGSQSLSAPFTLAHGHTVNAHTHSFSATTGTPSANGTAQGGSTGPVPLSTHTHPVSGTTDPTSPATDTQLADVVLAYIDVILAQKD